MESLQEISTYLSSDTRFDLKLCALDHMLHLTATADDRELLLKLPEMLTQLVIFLQDSCAAISKRAAQMLVNITGDESGTNAMVIISESSNLTEKNKSGKQNASESIADLTKLASIVSEQKFNELASIR